MSCGWAIEPTNDYPPEWKSGEIQTKLYVRAGYKCEHCGMEFVEGTTTAKHATRRDGKPFILTAHHLDGNKADCSWENVLVCCQKCHLSVQALWGPGQPLPPQWHNKPPRWLIERGLPYQKTHQPNLFPVDDISFADAFNLWSNGLFRLSDKPLEWHDKECCTPTYIPLHGGYRVLACSECGDCWHIVESNLQEV